MRKWTVFVLLVVLAIGMVWTSSEAEGVIKMSVKLSKHEFHGIEEIDVDISVTNISGNDMKQSVSLYNPSNKKIKEFGSPKLLVGETRTWSGTWTLTEKQLENGTVTFSVKYGNHTLSVSNVIEYTPPGVEITRTIVSSEVKGNATVTYHIVNNGQKDMQQVSIDEHNMISEDAITLGTIAVGEEKSYTFTQTMVEPYLISAGTVKYKWGAKVYLHRKSYMRIDPIMEGAEVVAALVPPALSPAPANIILIVDGEVYPLTEEQKLQISEIIQ